jgi:double-stranded uracil-DNA glycosylase
MERKERKKPAGLMEEIAGGGQFADGFPPIVGADPRVLLLGSMPGMESLRNGSYYGHRRNHFWPLIYGIFGEPLEEDYRKRIAFLKEHHIALWDVLSGCRRKGSLDSAIREEEYNDLAGFLEDFPTISTIFFNGRKAESSFVRYLRLNPGALQLMERRAQQLLPSSSPIPTRTMKRMEDKLSAWQAVAHAAESL